MPGQRYKNRRVPGHTRSITFDADVVEALDEVAEDFTIGRSALVNTICRQWLEDFEMPCGELS